MKKAIVTLTLLIASVCLVSGFANDDIPMENGKIVFSSEENVIAPKETIRQAFLDWAVEIRDVKKEGIPVDDQEEGLIVVRTKDNLFIEGSDWTHFDINISYSLVFSYKDNHYSVKLTNLNYFESMDGNTVTYPAEFILIEENYKMLTVKDANEKIKNKTLNYIEDLLQEIDELF